jgi:Beta-lactamase
MRNVTPKPIEYGFGVKLHKVEGRRAVSHGGGIQGYSSTLAGFPDQGVSIAILANCDGVGGRNKALFPARDAIFSELANAAVS